VEGLKRENAEDQDIERALKQGGVRWRQVRIDILYEFGNKGKFCFWGLREPNCAEQFDIRMFIGIQIVQTLKLTKVGTSVGAVIPKEMLSRMKVEKGDKLFAIETPEGYLLTPYDPAVEEQVKAGQEFMKEYRETFKALAK